MVLVMAWRQTVLQQPCHLAQQTAMLHKIGQQMRGLALYGAKALPQIKDTMSSRADPDAISASWSLQAAYAMKGNMSVDAPVVKSLTAEGGGSTCRQPRIKDNDMTDEQALQ